MINNLDGGGRGLFYTIDRLGGGEVEIVNLIKQTSQILGIS